MVRGGGQAGEGRRSEDSGMKDCLKQRCWGWCEGGNRGREGEERGLVRVDREGREEGASWKGGEEEGVWGRGRARGWERGFGGEDGE